ncbi:hypothetical protein K2O51_30860 (plasmid) [Cupriavidus pinatubonensis]|uniref:hypothetical protein n=1 Tax=Cupriavidus pinatubonensis TaxID=248026 RepID=UPI001C72BD93|nr:hypothetical protein [Cupriavidus pinatubonensis]QYY33650.1 hypothetical protein K2O51_30860 [Cupriavidus pinatubonensis]
MSAQAKERLMKVRQDLRSMPGALPEALLGDPGLAEMGTQNNRDDRRDAADAPSFAFAGSESPDTAEKRSDVSRPGFRFGPTLKPGLPSHDQAASAPSTTPAQAPEGKSDSRPARPSFKFAARAGAAQGATAEYADAKESSTQNRSGNAQPPRARGRESHEGAPDPRDLEAPPTFDADDFDGGFEQVAPAASTPRARFDARVAYRKDSAAPAYFGYQADGGVGGDQPCGIPGSAFIGYPSDLPIGTAYSRAVWSRATRQASSGSAVLEIRTAHGGSAMVVAPWSQSSETHGSNASPWADIDRALLIEVKYRAHAEQGYRNVKVGTAGFHKEMGTVEVDRPDLSSLKRELGGASDRLAYATVQIAADASAPQSPGRTEREFWVVLPEDTVRRLATRGSRQPVEPRNRTLGIWHNGILSRNSNGRQELQLADGNAGLQALPPVSAPDPVSGSALDAKWTEQEGDFVLDMVERLLARGMPTTQAEEAGIWALYEHRRTKLGLPESARPAFLVEPSGAGEIESGQPPRTEPANTPADEGTEPQDTADRDAVTAESATGLRFGFGARPRT